MLALVLVSLMLAAALITPLALFSSIEALAANRRAATLRHRLAADSAIAMSSRLLAADKRLDQALDRNNRASFTLRLEDLSVEVLLQDDTAKLPLPLLLESRETRRAADALAQLQSRAGLPQLTLRSEGESSRNGPRWSVCADDLFEDPTDAKLFGTAAAGNAWMTYITPVGGAIQVYRAPIEVLAAALADLQSRLGERIAQVRDPRDKGGVAALLAKFELPQPIARQAARRLTTQTERYSLLIRTQLGRDVRQRYVICTAGDPPIVVVDWEVAP